MLSVMLAIASVAATEPQLGRVLSPAVTPAVKALLQLDEPISPKLSLNASIARDHIVVTAGPKDKPILAVTLVDERDAKDGEYRVGDVALRLTPGPAPKQLVTKLKARLERSGGALSWIQPEPEQTEPIHAPAGTTDVAMIDDALRGADYRIAVDEPEIAIKLLSEIPADLTPPAAIEVALLWRRAGKRERAKEVLARHQRYPEPLETARKVILNDVIPLDVEGRSVDEICDLSQVAHLAAVLELNEGALRLLDAIRTAAPDCLEAYDIYLQIMSESGRAADAVSEAEAAMKRFSDSPQILSSGASIYLAEGRFIEGAELLEKAVRKQLHRRNPLRVLLGAVVRKPETRAHFLKDLTERRKTEPDDVIIRFLLGVILHYENQFIESNALLRPLEATLDHSDRLHIYRAMNDYNLGKTQIALDRLNRAAGRPDPDPDVYYCLAEIKRDFARAEARADLGRYAAFSHANPMSNPLKEERIERLLTLLDTCLEDQRESCEGEWEHPRLRHEKRERAKERLQLGSSLMGFVLLAASLIVYRRRRAR